MSLGADLDRFPDVKTSFDNGDIDTEQARSIIGLLLKVPAYTADIKNSANGGDFDDPAAECTDQCTKYLLTNGARENAEDTRRRVAGLASMLQPDDTTPPDDENERLNEFFASRTAGGRLRVKGHFDKATGEQLMTALSALSKPQPGRTTTSGKREPDPPHPTASRRIRGHRPPLPRHRRRPSEGGERPTSPSSSAGDLANATRGTDPEPRDQVARVHPIRRGPAWMPWLGPICLGLAAPISCDADITPITMDSDGNPLDVGRTTRLIPRRLRRALERPRLRLRIPRLRTTRRLDRRPPYSPLVQRRTNQPVEPGTALPLPPHPIHRGDWTVHIGKDQHPPPRTPSRGPQVHPTELDRPPTKTHPSPQPKSATTRLLTAPI